MSKLVPVRRFEASVTFRDHLGQLRDQTFPIHTHDYGSANRLAFTYVLAVLKLDEFELRVVGA